MDSHHIQACRHSRSRRCTKSQLTDGDALAGGLPDLHGMHEARGSSPLVPHFPKSKACCDLRE